MTHYCNYHPENIATNKCERCNRKICLDDLRVHRKQHSSGSGGSSHGWTSRHEYCPVCKSEVEISEAQGSAIGGMVAIFIGALFLFISSSGLISSGAPGGFVLAFVSVPLLIIGIGIYSILVSPTRQERARENQQEFLYSLKQSSEGVKIIDSKKKNKLHTYTRPNKTWTPLEMTCFQCGNTLSLVDDYCTNCGDSTQEERAQITRNS